MPAKSDAQLDLALPAEVMDLGRVLAATGEGTRVPGRADDRQPDARQVEAMAQGVLAKARQSPSARRALGVHATRAGQFDALRVKVVALLAFRLLRDEATAIDMGVLAAAVADPKDAPMEGLLVARHLVGTMAAEQLLDVVPEGSRPWADAHVRLPAAGLEWASGGRRSMGYLTPRKLTSVIMPEGEREDEGRPVVERPIPTVRELHAGISEHVVGLDEQVRVLSSLLVMHLVRARMLREGRDPRTANLAILLAGDSGCGKTWLMEVASKVTGCVFASMSATAMTSEGYIGGKLDDLFKALVMKAKGDVRVARFGLGFIDEWDAKATRTRSGHDVTTTALQHEILVPMQGAEFLITGKRAMERPVMFDSRGTFFAFAGAFDGLAEIVRKKANRTCIGFAAGAGTQRQRYVLDAIRDYGYLRAWVNRLTSVMFLPQPSLDSLEKAMAGGILDSFNALLGELGIVLFPHPAAIPRVARYALESRTFYRGLKSVWWNIAEAAVASGEKGTVLVGGADVDAAISRVASGAVGDAHPGEAPIAAEPPEEDGGGLEGSESGGG